MSQIVFRRKTARRCAQLLCLIAFCLASGGAKACFPQSLQAGILFEHIPVGIDAPVIAEVTIISRETNVTFSNGATLAVLNARVDKVIKGTLEGSAVRVVTYLNSCTTIGLGHGFIAGAMRHDPQRGFEVLAIHQPQLHTQPRP